MREGVPGLQMAEEMEGLARDLLPLASPLMDFMHQRYLGHFVEQDVVGHMEAELEEEEVGARARARRDRASPTWPATRASPRRRARRRRSRRSSASSRACSSTLPEDARVVKTIGDEVMLVGHDVRALVDWAVGFTGRWTERPEPRIGIHLGHGALPRRRLLRARGQPRLARRRARPRRGGARERLRSWTRCATRSELGFEGIGQVKLKGFDEPRQLCRATCARGRERGPARGGARERPGAAGRAAAGAGLGRRRLGLPARRGACDSGARVSALHVNYGLREGADDDEAFVRELCERLGVPLHVERVALPESGNLQDARARRALRARRAARPEATTRPRTRPATRPRRCSTGWPCRPARARCTAWRRGAGGSCGRCSP